jgi:uncharacterized protein YaaN involved in tellurite resistance
MRINMGITDNMDNDFNNENNNSDLHRLTLEPDNNGENFNNYNAPGAESVNITEEKKEYSAGSVDESMLTPQEREQVENFCKQINLSDVRQINSYGANAQRGIANFSTSITSRVKTQEFGEVGESLRALRVAIGSTMEPEKKGILGFLKKTKQKAQYWIANYETAETNIKKIEKDLQKHQQVLTKDVFVYDEMYKMNLQYYKEITMYIIAGKKALDIARKTTLVSLKEKAQLSGDQLDIQRYNDYENTCLRFEKKLSDLELSRTVSIQLAPQIRLLQNADQEVVDRLASDIINTIPLWRNQMVLALGIEHTRKALDAQSAVNEMTNELLRKNAETLKMGAIDAAKASESGIVDIETLRKCNDDIISSINEVVKIHEEGSRKRAEAEVEIVRIEEELKQALLAAGNR